MPYISRYPSLCLQLPNIQVPAMRLIFDFVVHLIMLVLYTDVVLSIQAGTLTTTEVVLIIYVTVSP